MVSKIWVGTSTNHANNVNLLHFNIQGHLQKQYFKCQCITIHFEEKKSKICFISVAILLFSHQNAGHPEYFRVYFCDKTIRCASKWFIIAQTSRDRHCEVCYLHTTYLDVLKHVKHVTINSCIYIKSSSLGTRFEMRKMCHFVY